MIPTCAAAWMSWLHLGKVYYIFITWGRMCVSGWEFAWQLSVNTFCGFCHLIHLFFLFCFFSIFFFKGYRSQGQTPWTRGTSRTTISDPQWTTPLDANRAASCISLSFILSQPAAPMSCQAVPPPPAAPVSPPSPLPAGSVLTLNMAAVTNMTHLFQTLLTPRWPPSFFLIETNGLRAINYHRAPFLQPAACLAPHWSLADSGRSPARQPSRASAQPNTCQVWRILWQQTWFTPHLFTIPFRLCRLHDHSWCSETQKGNVCRMPQCLTTLQRIYEIFWL